MKNSAPPSTPKLSTSTIVEKYIKHPEVVDIIEKLKHKPGGYPVSDIFCEDPENKDKYLYFVDLVQEGGGVLGVALVGYTYALEAAGIRFLNLGGTSAGAINTMLMAGIDKPVKAKSVQILNELCSKNFKSFVDPGFWVLWPLKLMFKTGYAPRFFGFSFLFIFNLFNILFKRGLCSGFAFESWVEEILQKQGIDSLEQLQARMNDLPANLSVKTPTGNTKKINAKTINPRLAIIAADITTQTKVEFPRLAHLYADMNAESSALRPKDIVRASMAIPLFYQPKSFSPPQSENHKKEWATLAGYFGPIPTKVFMVDGGVMSNFPIDIFHKNDRTPLQPTFGVRLGLNRHKSTDVVDLTSLVASTFNGARNLRDFEFLFQNEDYKLLVKYINTEDFNWLDFSISEEKKLQLFALGVKAAYEFLEGDDRLPNANGFNWKQYKALRRRMLFFSSTDRMESLWKREDAIGKLGLNKKGILNTLANTFKGQHDDLPAPIQQWFHENVEALDANLKRIGKYPKRREKMSILWLDNDPANDCFELSVLRALGINFFTALDNASALQKLSDHPEICLIVSDSNRDGNPLAGLEFARKLYQKKIDKPIIMHSTVLASKYNSEHGKSKYIQEIRQEYSPRILNNFVDTRELIAAIVKVIAEEIASQF